MSATETSACPLCGTLIGSSCSLSQMDGRTRICHWCASIETRHVRVDGADGPRRCLHYDESAGIVLLAENEVAYEVLFSSSVADPDWCRHYVHETNDRIGRGPSTVNTIVMSALAA